MTTVPRLLENLGPALHPPLKWLSTLSLVEIEEVPLTSGSGKDYSEQWCSELAGRLGNGAWQADRSLES